MGQERRSLDAELGLAIRIAREAAEEARRSQGRHLNVQQKSGPDDLVSDADRALDALIVGRLLRQFPDDGALSEEGGRVSGVSGRTWVVDPIDGTHNYLAGTAHYGITIALLDGPATVLGVVYDASTRSVHSATLEQCQDPKPGSQARYAVASALVAVNLPVSSIFSGAGLRPPLDQIGDIRITGSLALDLVWTALGRFDACIYRHRDNPWDWAAGELIALSYGKQVVRSLWESVQVVAVGRHDVTSVLSAKPPQPDS